MTSRISLSILSIVTLTITLNGCGSAEPDPRGQRVPVDGQVTLDGQPLSHARIVFISEGGHGSVKANAEVADGSFSLSAANGPLSGSARVTILPELMELEEFEAARGPVHSKPVEARAVTIPPRYNLQSTLTAQLEADGENHLTFELFSN